jgi:hypothetical protein
MDNPCCTRHLMLLIWPVEAIRTDTARFRLGITRASPALQHNHDHDHGLESVLIDFDTTFIALLSGFSLFLWWADTPGPKNWAHVLYNKVCVWSKLVGGARSKWILRLIS